VFLAPRAICSRAHAGLIAARARRLIIDKKVEDHAEVPARLWWAEGGAALKQNWATGDFETWTDHQVHYRAYGVDFLRADIEAMLPASSRRREVSAWQPGNYAEASRCLDELSAAIGGDKARAGELIIRNCRAGLVPSRCTRLRWRVSDRYGDEDQSEENTTIPDWVWEHCLGEPDAILNWPANIFAGEGEIDGDRYKVTVSGVQFEVGAVIAVEKMELSSRSPAAEEAKPSEDRPKLQGRRLSSEWPFWVAELVATIHEEGAPAGLGSQGQEELIKRVADRLAERGREPLGRSTVQPVVQAVLDRLRAAEN
jgi:hypothetical protein